MANDTLYNSAASLLQGATSGEADAGKTYSNIADTKIKDATLAQGSQIDREKMSADAQGRSADNEAAMEREKLKEKGATDRTNIQQAGETKRQFTTMTPELIRGLDTADPKGGWAKTMKPGQTMQTDVMLGLLTARLKHDSIKSGITDVMVDGQPIKMGYSFDPDNGFKIQPLGGSIPKDGKSGAKNLSDKDLMTLIRTTSKDLQGSLEKGDLGEGFGGVMRRMSKGGRAQDALASGVKKQAGTLRDAVNQAKSRGLDVSDIPPELLELSAEEAHGSVWTEEKEKRRQELLQKEKDGTLK